MPPPPMILSGELEIYESHSQEGGHQQQNAENQQQHTVQGVQFEAPYACKEIMQLNVDCTER
jgi:hypothetical protein